MTTREWLLAGDPAIARLVQNTLFGKKKTFIHEGWISQYLSAFDPITKRFGEGIYSPKWVSTFYTIRELAILGVDPRNKIFQEGIATLLEAMWNRSRFQENDVCVLAMLLSMAIYAKVDATVITSMTESLMKYWLPDGGFNCNSVRRHVQSSSVHTTLSVLEAMADLQASDYLFDKDKVQEVMNAGQRWLLRKGLMRRERDHRLMFTGIDQFHYPTRWKYDILRALTYFARNHVPYDSGMEEALDLLRKRMEKGILPQGTIHSGKLHFKLEKENIQRMNMLHGLIVLKEYDFAFYEKIMKRNIEKKI